MAPLTQSTLTVTGLSNGAHTLKVSLAGSDHAETGEPDSIGITVEGSEATGDVSVAEVEPMAGEEEHGHKEEALDVDVSGLKLELVYAGQTTSLTLEPAEGGEPGQYVASFTPERAGQYTLHITGTLNGSLGSAEVDAEVEPEEVEPNPNAPADSTTTTESGGLNSTAIAVIVGVGVLLVAAVIGAVVISRRK
jgi:hypothetical protein